MKDVLMEDHQMMNREEMIAELRKRKCRVIFKKANGEERDMMCTLHEDWIPATSKDQNTDKESKSFNNDVIRVIDVGSEQWRSFRVDSVISFDCTFRGVHGEGA